MRNISILVVITILLFFACNSSSNTESTADLTKFEKITTTPFTDTIKLDTFKVSWKGKTAKGSVLLFKIVSYKGEEIYQTRISVDELVKGNEKLKTEAEKLKFLKNEINYFFEEEHFLWPAVIPAEKPDKNVPDKAFYEELKQTKLNGFNYRTGNESKVYIAWSEKENKVKVYYKL